MPQPPIPPGLPGLPVEIMEFIIEHMMDSNYEGSLSALAATCRGMHAIVMPRLYGKDVVDRHPALIFWAAQLGRFDTAKRLIDAGVNLNRAMIRNEPMTLLMLRTAAFTPRQLYQDYRIINTQISPQDNIRRVGPRGFVGGCIKSQLTMAGHNAAGFANWRSWWLPIHLAIRGGFADLVDLFVASGALLQVPSSNLCECKQPPGGFGRMPLAQYRRPWTPLHTAICSHRIEIAQTLLKQGASVTLSYLVNRSANSFTALHNAAGEGSADLVKFILDNKYQTDVQVLDDLEISPLWHAYLQRGDNWDVIDALLERGANINDDLAAGYTPLIDACLFGNFANALELVARGADVNVVCTGYPINFSCYRWAAMNNVMACLRGHRALDLCCLKQQRTTRGLRFNKFPNPRFVPHTEAFLPPPVAQPVPVLEEHLRMPLVQALLDAGADLGPSKHSPSLAPPLVAAAAEHLVDVVRLLLDHGAEVDGKDKDGNTPLMAALNYSLHWCPSHAKVGPMSSRPFGLQRPGRNVATVLPAIGAPPQAVIVPPQAVAAGPPPPPPPPPQINGTKPPTCRQKGDLTACVKLLLDRGADPMATNCRGDTPLSLTYSYHAFPDKQYVSRRPRGHLTFVERAVVAKMLLERGADPNTLIHIEDPDAKHSDVDSDDPDVYSASDTSDSLDTPPGSDDDSSQGSIHGPSRRRFRSLFGSKPLSVLHCAFWDGDLDLCRLLLEHGAKLSPPVVAWMLHVTWVYCRWRMRFAAGRALQVLGDLEVGLQTELAAHPACLYVLIRQGVRHMAAELLEIGIERSKFDDSPGQEYPWLFRDQPSRPASWGSVCLTQAVRTGWDSVVETLLRLGIDVNTQDVGVAETPLALAVGNPDRDSEMVELLIRYGAHVNIADDRQGAVKFRPKEPRYPLVSAIRRENIDIMGILVRTLKEPMPENFAFAYIKEAYMNRRVTPLSCLLGLPLVTPHCTSMDEGNTHLVEILQNISTICTYTVHDVDLDEESLPWALTIQSRLDKVQGWMDCLILLAHQGISPTIPNNAGVSAIELFGEMLNYTGLDRFKAYVRSALRSRLSSVMGDEVWADSLSPVKAFGELTRCEVKLTPENDGTVSSDGLDED